MHPKSPKITTWFTIAGHDLDIGAVTAAVGIEPTKVWTQTRTPLRERRDLATENWMIGHEKIPSQDLDDSVAKVLDLVWPVRDRIKEFATFHSISIFVVCNVHIYGDIYCDRPVYELSLQTIRRLAELTAAFTMDLFVESIT